jgi:hypothetical protein
VLNDFVYLKELYQAVKRSLSHEVIAQIYGMYSGAQLQLVKQLLAAFIFNVAVDEPDFGQILAFRDSKGKELSSGVPNRSIFNIDILLLLFDAILDICLKLINQVLWDILLLRQLLLNGLWLDLAGLIHILFLNINSSLKGLFVWSLDNSLTSSVCWHGTGVLQKSRVSLTDVFLEASEFVLIVLLKTRWVSCASCGRKSENVIIPQKIVVFLIEDRLGFLCF